jgi:DNA segregation ATPase FtsK/SpoIIIE-like protein
MEDAKLIGQRLSKDYMDYKALKPSQGSAMTGAGAQLPSASVLGNLKSVPSDITNPVAKKMIADLQAKRSGIAPAPQVTPQEANTLVTLGKDIEGKPVQEDLKDMPHMLIAGQTGSGKSYKMNEMLQELMHNNTPDKLKMMLVDPKGTEFPDFDNKYSVLPKGAVKDPETAISALTWLNGEMNNRLANGTNNPKIVLAVDELADLLQNSPASTQRILGSLAAKTRSAGIHMMLATQRPDADVLKGIMKANIPARMAFKTPDKVNSNIILGRSGAEALEPHQSIYMSPQHGEPQQLFPTSYTGPAAPVAGVQA